MNTIREIEIAMLEIEETNDELMRQWYKDKLGSRYGRITGQRGGAENQEIPDRGAGEPVRDNAYS